MSDFQKVISALRSVGVSVTVVNKEDCQIALIEGEGIGGSIFTREDDEDEA